MIHTATVTRASGGQVYVTVQDIGGDQELGPYEQAETATPLAAGDRVIAGQLGRVPEQLVILGRLT